MGQQWHDVKEHSQLCAWYLPLQWWRRLSRIGAPHCRLRWRELVFGSGLPSPTSGRCLAGIGELRKGLEEYVTLGHAGWPEGGLFEQVPRGGSVPERRLPGFGWRRHRGPAPADS